MYRVITEQRGARVDAIPRLGAADGYAMDVPAVREAASMPRSCGCAARTTRPPCRSQTAPSKLARRPRGGRRSDGRQPAIVVLDEAYAEFVDRSLLGLRERHPNLIVVRTASKAYGLAGLRVGFGIARPEVIARLNPFRPPGSVSTVSVTVVTEALLDPTAAAANVARVVAERERLRGELIGAGLVRRPVGHELRARGLGSTERAAAVAEGLLRNGLVPRTFPAGHPLADHLRLTVRAPDENDRLIAAARETRRGARMTTPAASTRSGPGKAGASRSRGAPARRT